MDDITAICAEHYMATSTIKDNKIHYVDFSVAGTAVTSADAGWYYAELDLPNTIPQGTLVIGVAKVGTWDASVFFNLYGNTKLLISSPTSRTLGSNRSVRIFYQYF